MTHHGLRPGRAALGLAAASSVALAIASPWLRSGKDTRVDPGLAAARPSVRVVHTSGVRLGQVVRDGLKVECRVEPLGPSDEVQALREGRDVRVSFAIADTAGGAPLTRGDPAAWVVEHPADAPPLSPREAAHRAATLVQGSLFSPPEIDLNSFYVVTLNQNPTLSVVDPKFGFGGSKLLALVALEARGDDWAPGPGGREIFVAMPETGRVAVVETQGWTVAANLPGGIRPHRLAMHPDGRHLWVAGGVEDGSDSGVTILDVVDRRVAARVRTGRGRHEMAFGGDGRHAFVTNADDGDLTVLDAATHRVVGSAPTGPKPTALAYSALAGLAYVTHADGSIAAVDPRGPAVAARIASEPGLATIRFTPDGRAGFVINTATRTVSVLDPARNRLVQSVKVDEGPDRVTFTDEFAYVRHRGSPNVTMIGLAAAGREGAALSIVTFPAGESPPVAGDLPTPADSIVPAPGSGAVLVANPRDRSVYYYKQGLSAPMGTFSNYKREPRAVLVIDRSLRERSRRGVYETTVRLERPGRFDLVFFLDQPRIAHAFTMEVQADPAKAAARDRGKVEATPLVASPRADAGRPFRPLFQIDDRSTRAPKTGLVDVQILMYRVGEGWNDRLPATEIAPGVYAAEFLPREPGFYHVCIECPSGSLALTNPGRLTIHIETPTDGPSGSGSP